MKDPVGTKYRCTSCGEYYSKQQDNFLVSNSPLYEGWGGYVPTCKTCGDKYFKMLVNFYSGNDTKALDHMAAVFDWYYCDDAVNMALNTSHATSLLTKYSNKLGLKQIKDRGTTYLDTIKDRTTDNIETVGDLEKALDSNEFEISTATVKFFGFGYSAEQYIFLQEQYDDWTMRHECKTKAQEELFKALCIAQLNIMLSQQQNKDVNESFKTFQALMGSANLKPQQNTDNALSDSNTFGTLIKKWENEKPIPEADPAFADVDGIVRYITVYFLGHLCKMMGIKNSYARAYEEEMDKYKVGKPEYEDDTEALFDSIFHTNEESDLE